MATESVSVCSPGPASRAWHTVLSHPFFGVSPEAIHFPKDNLAWERTTVKDEFITWLSSRTPSSSLLNIIMKILAATSILSWQPEEKSQGGWEWKRKKEGANVFVFYHWISSSTDTSQLTFIVCITSTLNAGEFCWDPTGIKEMAIRWFYWFWHSN